MITTIPSILNGDKIAFAYHTDLDLWDSFYRANRPLDCHIGVFETYGDGTTQHSGAWAATNEHFTDFCISFATWLLSATPEQIEASSIYGREQIGLNPVPVNLIDFLAKITYREDKDQYFSRELLKVTTSEKVRHDRRYLKVPTHADGSFRAVTNLYFMERERPDCSHLRWYTEVSSLAERMNCNYALNDEDEKYGFKCATIFPGDYSQAYHALCRAYDCIEGRKYAKSLLNCAINVSG